LISATVALVCVAVCAAPAAGAEHPALARARALYNAADFDGAIVSAGMARSDPVSSDAAALVMARAYLERFRLRADPADLANARVALTGIRAAALTPRDQLDLLIGLGQSLYLAEQFGAAAEIFDAVLSRVDAARGPLPQSAAAGEATPGRARPATTAASLDLTARDRLTLLDWWATALDREAPRRVAEGRAALYERIATRMETELRADPANPSANYWLAAAARGLGDLDRSFDVAAAAWVRSRLSADAAESLRADLDRLVTQALIPERSRQRPVRDLQAEWDAIKQQWK
jgi:hypothetical protein